MKKIITIVLLVSLFAQIGAMTDTIYKWRQLTSREVVMLTGQVVEMTDMLAYDSYHTVHFECPLSWQPSPKIVAAAGHLLKMMQKTHLKKTQEALIYHANQVKEAERLEYYEKEEVIEAVKILNKKTEEKLEEAKHENDTYLEKLKAIKTLKEEKVSRVVKSIEPIERDPMPTYSARAEVRMLSVNKEAEKEEYDSITALVIDFTKHNPVQS